VLPVCLCVVCLSGAIIATSFTLGRKDNLHKVMRWIHENTAAGLVIFGLLYVWFTVMFLPPALLAACAGALYGFLLAIPIVWFFAIVSTSHRPVRDTCIDRKHSQLCVELVATLARASAQCGSSSAVPCILLSLSAPCLLPSILVTSPAPPFCPHLLGFQPQRPLYLSLSPPHPT
jgi:hypothetical protein